MHQDKDRSGKWLIAHHGEAILKLAGYTGFTEWKAVQQETVAPRRLPDGLLEVRFPNEKEPVLVLVEIEAYADADADRQMFEDIQIVSLVRGIVPEAVCIVLKPKGQAKVAGRSERMSRYNTTHLAAAWKVVELWKLRAEDLFARNDPGLIPWVPLTQTTATPVEVMQSCRDRIGDALDEKDRVSLLAATEIFSIFAFGPHPFNFFRGTKMPLLEKVLEDPAFDEIKERIVEARHGNKMIHRQLQKRFGEFPRERIEPLFDVMGEQRQEELLELAMTCPDLDSFIRALDAIKS